MSPGRAAAQEKRPGYHAASLSRISSLARDSDASRPPLRQRARDAVRVLYQATVVELILRRRHIGASKDGRHIPLAIEHEKPLVDTRRGHAYVSNNVRTSRYTIWDFIPKQLLFQFSRIGNFYFLCVGIPQTIPGLSTTGSFTTILPLLFFVLLTVAKEGFDDYRRHRLDKVENATLATLLGREDKYMATSKPTHSLHRWNPLRTKAATQSIVASDDEFQGIRWFAARWSHVKVGDIVRLSRDEPVPADLVLLHSDGNNGIAYVDTMALDGETNLKTKQVCHALDGCDSIESIAKCRAEFVVEDPNPDLFNFNGRVTVDGKVVPLTLNDVVYRGSVLRNTTCAIGLVINTGEECKLRMNSNQHPRAKRPALEKVVNKVVVTLAIYVIVLSVGVSMGYLSWQKHYERQAWYLDRAAVPFHQIIIAFIIMFNNIVPLSLYISLEIVKLGQLLLLNSDLEMYHEETDTPARCNTNTILENLGQVGYVFSDKTGTLTDNVMNFRKLSVAGTVWLHEMDLEQADLERPPAFDPNDGHSTWRSPPNKPEPTATVIPEDGGESAQAREYLLAVAICHTCLPETKDGKVEFQASSPDELALVRAAQELGYLVTQRTPQSITLQVPRPNGPNERMVFQVLDVVEFSSARKRMSIIVRYPDGRISIICKGADSAILPRLRLSSLAMQKANEVRKSADLERELYRRSEQQEPRNSFGGRPSLTVRRNAGVPRDLSVGRRPSARSKSFEINKLTRSSVDRARASAASPRGVSLDVSRSQFASPPTTHTRPVPDRLDFLDDPAIYDESEVFTKCFKHLDDFATEGLRTLLYAQKFVSEQDYRAWKTLYDDATTSLTNRQEKIEAAGDMMEQSFDLVGATAIEDKLQKGVPETIDRLRRANIKIWMLTGDKRETAINIAHSARICRPGSDLYVLDVAKSTVESQLAALAEDLQAGSVHSVVVVDGQTLSVVEKSVELSKQFFAIAILVDSVICCRASPAQKALLVHAVRSRLGASKGKDRRGLTLAIGDGANDLAMIQASHVGIGISGNEGLQAARVADYAIAQFRFLQRLLLVHGRWNYVRTAKFILCTFWKEMFFYLPTAQYQRYNGYSGTSLYQEVSLTVFNTLFTSLCTICMGIWEQDLSADTLLAVPELYIYGQRNLGLNMWKYLRWMFLAAVEGIIVWHGVSAGYGWISPGARDEGLYALGTLAFTVGVLWINWKLFILETHYKPAVVIASFLVTTWGWFAWIAFLDGIYPAGTLGPYAIRHTFRNAWGKDAAWWATLFAVLAFLGLLELCGKAVRRRMLVAGLWQWPPWRRQPLGDNVEEWDVELWQEMERDPAVRERLRALARNEECVVDEARADEDANDDDDENDVTRTRT
ncbi:haloacid dehalogenase-like hydrolase domain-containing protein [Hirsutella rhossiliensis]|uniref:Phospholipid-transporting ATPase n=1 Tax=Hirsutella rhossiliensis TaxID=111463 RepID=A0A9P8SNG7_9HYPO|nr:haloacid dehalogenase-like hydrolase domain-containing protein [Hirsutella rhossiliensis]KAH0967161.1 haloacid dehalogenase-like hydrolase domain-containing protein [Hirsutella rhossiliensis]